MSSATSRASPGRPSGTPGRSSPARVRVLLAGHRRGDLPGRDGIDRDPVLGELERHRLRQAAEPVLGGGVGRRSAQRDVLVDRGDVDDPSSDVALHHQPGGGLCGEERADEVDVEHVAKLIQRHVEKGRGGPAPRAVDENVEAAESRGERAYRRLHRSRVGQIEVAHDRVPAVRADLLGRPSGSLLVAAEGDADVVPPAGEGDCRRAADAGVRARDDRTHDAGVPGAMAQSADQRGSRDSNPDSRFWRPRV